jgi:hypothetical protein
MDGSGRGRSRYGPAMQALLDVLGSAAAGGDDDPELAWTVTVNDLVVRVEAATRETFVSQDDAWFGAQRLRGILVAVLGWPQTDEDMRVVAVAGEPHGSAHEGNVFRGAVRMRWAPTTLGQLRQPSSENQG